MTAPQGKHQRTRISGLYRYMTKRGIAIYRSRLPKNRGWLTHGSDFALAQKRHRELMGRGPVMSSAMTLSEAHEQWLVSYVSTERCVADQKNTKGRWLNHANDVIGHKMLAKLGTEDIRTLKRALAEGRTDDKGEQHILGWQSQGHVLADVRCFLNWCVEAGLLDRSPWPKKIMPEEQETLPKRLSDEEVEAVLGIDEPYRFICRFFLGTGLRWGEGCRAQRSHVDGDELAVPKTKNRKVRWIPLVNPVAGTELLPDVLGRVGRMVPFSERSHGSFARVVKNRTGVAGFHVHRLRHTFGCRYLEGGGSLLDLQEIMGHSSIEITQKYAKLSRAHIRREARRLAEAR